MMKVILGLAAVVVLCGMLSGCGVVAPVVPPLGWVYSDVKAPIDIDVNNTSVTGKKGTSTSMSILAMVATGDASVKAAADQGGITRVDHIDYEYFNILFIFQKYTTVVYGQ